MIALWRGLQTVLLVAGVCLLFLIWREIGAVRRAVPAEPFLVQTPQAADGAEALPVRIVR